MADTSLFFDIFARDRGADRALRQVARDLDDVAGSTGALRRDTSRLAAATDDMTASQARAGLAARRAGLAASEAGDRAQASQRRAATAAERLARGEISQEQATRAATRAARDLERALIAQETATLAASDSTQELGDKAEAAGTQMSGMRTSGITALVALAAGAVPAAAGLLAFGAIAAPAVMKVVSAQKDLAAAQGTLTGSQKVAAAGTHLLISDYQRLAKAYEPQTLTVFNTALGIGHDLLGQLGPVFKAGTQSAQGFVNQVGELTHGHAFQDFFGFIAANAVPATHDLGQALSSTTTLALSTVQSIAPLGIAALHATGGVLSLASAAAQTHPELVQLGITALLLRGPVTGISSLASKAGTGIKAFAAETRGASLASRALQLVTKAGPGIFIAAAVAVGVLAIKLGTATTATDGMIGRLAAQNEAWGNNLGGYAKLSSALSKQITLQKQLESTQHNVVGSSGKSVVVSGYQSVAMTKLNAAYATAVKAQSNITVGSAALSKEFGITSAQAVKLANAAGVDLSKGILKSGEVSSQVRSQLTQYQAAVAAAKDPTTVIGAAWDTAADAALTLKDRTTALSNAMAAYFNPSIALYQSTNQIRDAFDKSAAAILGAKKGLDGHTASSSAARAQLGTLLPLVAQNATNLYTFTSSTKGAAAATKAMQDKVRSQLPILYALAGNSKNARDQVDALAVSSHLAAGTQGTTKAAFMASALAMDITKGHAEKLWAAFEKIPGQKRVTLTATIADLQAKIEAAKAKLGTVPPSKRAALLGDIRDLYAKVAAARRALASVHGKTVDITVKMRQVAGQPLPAPHFNANGSVTRYAGGGVRHDLPPHITDTPTVLYGEPETGGEAYIPLGTGKRQRSQMLLGQVADRFGLVVSRRMAGGGLLTYARGGFTRSSIKVGGTTNSTAQQNAGASLLASLTASMMSSTSKVSSFFKTLNTDIRKFLKGGTETAMLRWSKRMQTAMEGLTAKSTALTDKIKAAKDFASSTTDSAKSYASVTGLDFGGHAITAGGAAVRLGARLTTLSNFAASIKTLAKRGLSKTMLRQIIEGGPEQAGQLAAALASASGSDISRLNTVQGQIDKAATGLGQTSANALYDSGKKAGQGFLSGLLGQQGELEKAMTKLAASIAKTLKKELKIHSPSLVTKDLGLRTSQGVAVGLVAGVPAVRGASALLASAAVPAPRPVMAPVGARTGSAQGGGPMVIVLRIGDKDLGELIIDPLRKAVDVRGGNVQAAVGRGR